MQLICGEARNVLKTFPDNYFQAVVTSPPYWLLRNYQQSGQLGLEKSPDEYVDQLMLIMQEVKRTLRNDGILWLNIGDTYGGRNEDNGAIRAHGTRKKDLVGIPWMVAFAMKKDGWILRNDIIVSKTNPMPDGAKDRPSRSHEYFFMFTKQENYYYDYYSSLEDSENPIETLQRFGARHQEGTYRHDQNRVFEHYGKRNKRSVWSTSVGSCGDYHYAVFPEKLIDPCIATSISQKGACIKCGKPIERILEKQKIPANNNKGYDLKLITTGWEKKCDCDTTETKRCIVLDPFSGTGMTGKICSKYDVDYVGIDINPNYIEMSKNIFLKNKDMFTEIL